MTYNEFIQNILDTRGRFGIPDGEYKERHHIVPKCLGGTNDKENLIDLYAREHYEAHRMLSEENPTMQPLVYAWWLMANMENPHENRYVLSAEEYEVARKAYAEVRSSIRGSNHPNYGKPMSEEQKQKLSRTKTGVKLSQDTIEKIRVGHIGIAAGGKNPRARKVVCDGILFDCIEDCANYFGVKCGAMKMWLRGKNKMPEKFYKMGLQYEGQNVKYDIQIGLRRGKNHPGSKKIVCDGKIFDTLASCAENFGVKPATMCAWLKGRNSIPQRFKDMGLAYWNGGDVE